MLSLRETADLLSNTELHGSGELRFSGVSTDSRSVAPGELFVALSGEHFDGHAFVSAAAARGASAALVERPIATALPTIRVTSTRRALGELARAWRRRFAIPIIAVVGSNGKTTTKEMLAAILAAEFGAAGRLATVGNLNNEIGLPLTLLGLQSRHRAAVLEIGMNHPGETRWLAQIAEPTVVLITNAQREHQEFMVSVAAVAAEHALAIEVLPESGAVVFLASEPHAQVWREAAGGRSVLEFVLNDQTLDPVAMRAVADLGLFDTVIRLASQRGTVTARLSTAGLHNAENATAAATAALAAGVSLESVQRGLEHFVPVRGRLQPRRTLTGALLIDDTYNANPDSVRAALAVLGASPGPRLAVLGDMGEVGQAGPAFHVEIGHYARERGIDFLFATGEQMRNAVAAFGEGARHFPALDDLIQATHSWLDQGLQSPPTVLVKGSRFMRMETVIEALAVPHASPPERGRR